MAIMYHGNGVLCGILYPVGGSTLGKPLGTDKVVGARLIFGHHSLIGDSLKS